MTNTEQIRTKKISFILALSVIIFAAIATYFTLCHDINIMRITTPVILGLAMSIILCGVLQKFFYNWLTKNPIHFSFGEQSSPVIESEGTIDTAYRTTGGFFWTGVFPIPTVKSRTCRPWLLQWISFGKVWFHSERTQRERTEKTSKSYDAIREYVTIKTAPYLSKEAIATLISNIEYMACDQPELYKPIRSNIDKPLRSPGLRHLAWNVGERLRVPLAKRAVFIKESFPYELENASLEYLRLNLRDQVASQIPIDVPEKGDYRFHLETDNDES